MYKPDILIDQSVFQRVLKIQICMRLNLYSLAAANVPDDEWNLLYVAITRAKRTLYITKTISNILTFTGVSSCCFIFILIFISRDHDSEAFVLFLSFPPLPLSQEYFLKSELTSTLLSKDPSLVCSIEDCQNHVTADSVLSMCRLPIRYVSVSLLEHSFKNSLPVLIQCMCFRWTAWTRAAFCV